MKLQINKLNKSFGDKVVLRDLSYTFQPKAITLLKGESGVGKTTLLRIISGLEKADSGVVTGINESGVSYAFQEHRLIPGISALDNITVACYGKATDDDRNEALQMLLRLKLTKSDAMQLPKSMSGGMKQRASLARAFLSKAPILLLDEPFKELDAGLVIIVKEIIKELAKTKTVILVSHSDTEDYADYTLQLDRL